MQTYSDACNPHVCCYRRRCRRRRCRRRRSDDDDGDSGPATATTIARACARANLEVICSWFSSRRIAIVSPAIVKIKMLAAVPTIPLG